MSIGIEGTSLLKICFVLELLLSSTDKTDHFISNFVVYKFKQYTTMITIMDKNKNLTIKDFV